MKNRTKFSFIVAFTAVLLMGLAAQSAFAEKWNRYEEAFVEAFEKSDLAEMERVLKGKDSKTNMSALLYTVLCGYSSDKAGWITFRENTYFEPLNNDKRTAFAVIELLIKYGVNLNRYADYFYFRVKEDRYVLYCGSYESTLAKKGPLALAIDEGFNQQVLKLMLDAGSSPNPTGDAPISPLQSAVEMGNIGVVRLLLEYGANVNNKGSGSFSRYPLFSAACTNLEITKLLVESGARVNLETPELRERTAAQYAHAHKQYDIYLYLKEHGATWTAPDHAALVRQYGNSPPPVASYDAPSYDEPSAPSAPAQSSGERIAQALTQGLQQVQDTLRGSLDTGRYRVSGRAEEITFTGMANNGNLYYKDASGKTSSGTYSINGDRITINVLGRSFFYNITSRTSFSGNGEEWFRAGN